MRKVYPVIMEPLKEGGYLVTAPDFDRMTQGDDMNEAIYMAKDLICLLAITYQDDGTPIPEPSPIENIKCKKGEILAIVDVDFDQYRRMLDNRSIRKNVTLPSWLNELAEKNAVNFSAVLQDGLKNVLHVQDR